jgi:hypothetical protein
MKLQINRLTAWVFLIVGVFGVICGFVGVNQRDLRRSIVPDNIGLVSSGWVFVFEVVLSCDLT